MPALEALLDQFHRANTQVLGVSVDSVHCHANWAASLGGISFPLLADFHPKGQVAESFGMYADNAGITLRATVVIDAAGVIRYTEVAKGQRDMEALARRCAAINDAFTGELAPQATPPGIPAGATLWVKSNCGFSRAVLLARDNLHLAESLPTETLAPLTGAPGEPADSRQAPRLDVDGSRMFESTDIIRYLVDRVAPL